MAGLQIVNITQNSFYLFLFITVHSKAPDFTAKILTVRINSCKSSVQPIMLLHFDLVISSDACFAPGTPVQYYSNLTGNIVPTLFTPLGAGVVLLNFEHTQRDHNTAKNKLSAISWINWNQLFFLSSSRILLMALLQFRLSSCSCSYSCRRTVACEEKLNG